MNEQIKKLIQIHGDKYSIESLDGCITVNPKITGMNFWFIDVEESTFSVFEASEVSCKSTFVKTFDNIFDAIEYAESLT